MHLWRNAHNELDAKPPAAPAQSFDSMPTPNAATAPAIKRNTSYTKPQARSPKATRRAKAEEKEDSNPTDESEDDNEEDNQRKRKATTSNDSNRNKKRVHNRRVTIHQSTEDTRENSGSQRPVRLRNG